MNMGRSVFDGFCHRPFIPKIDGWRDSLPEPPPVVALARQILDMQATIESQAREIWELQESVAAHKARVGF